MRFKDRINNKSLLKFLLKFFFFSWKNKIILFFFVNNCILIKENIQKIVLFFKFINWIKYIINLYSLLLTLEWYFGTSKVYRTVFFFSYSNIIKEGSDLRSVMRQAINMLKVKLNLQKVIKNSTFVKYVDDQLNLVTKQWKSNVWENLTSID